MNVCDVTNFYSPKSGGVKTYLQHKSRYIQDQSGRHQHLLIIPGETDSTQVTGNATTIQIQGPQVWWEKNYRFIANITRLQEVLAERRPDIIELGCPYSIPWAVRRVARHFNIPLVGFFHSNFPETYVYRILARKNRFIAEKATKLAWKYARSVYGLSDIVVAASRYSEQHLHSAGIHHTVRIPFGVDTSVFRPDLRSDAVRSSLGIARDEILLLYVGRLSQEKNLHRLLEAMEIIHLRSDGKCRLVIVGSGPLREEIEQVEAKKPYIQYAGYRSALDGLPELYASADIFVFPSYNETFGLSALEALSSGLPVVAVKGGAVSETLPDGLSEVSDPMCATSIAEATLRMIKRLKPEMRLMIRDFCIEHFSWQRTFDQLFLLYETIIEKRKSCVKP